MAGLLGQIIGGMVAGNLGRRAGMGRMGGGGLGGTVLNGVLIALATKAATQYMQQRGQDRSFDPQAGGMSGGMGGGLGGILGGLGGAGALGALLNQLRQKGFSQQVDSWVQPGPNQPLAPQQLADALGDDTVEALAEETGMPRQALLSELSTALPEAVDELTPNGQEPSDDDLNRIGNA